MVFQCINIRQVPWEVLKTTAFGLGFQHPPRDLPNVNIRQVPWEVLKTTAFGLGFQHPHGTCRMLMYKKTMFDPYNIY